MSQAPADLHPLVLEYLHELHVLRQLSPHTLKAYRMDLSELQALAADGWEDFRRRHDDRGSRGEHPVSRGDGRAAEVVARVPRVHTRRLAREVENRPTHKHGGHGAHEPAHNHENKNKESTDNDRLECEERQ